MRNLSVITACAGIALLAGSAQAGDGEFIITDWFEVGDGLLEGGAFFDTDIELIGEPQLRVVGFEVRFDYGEPTPDDSWASDVQVIVTAPLGEVWTVGGLDNLGDADDVWSFQGSGSDAPGHYGDSGDDIFLPWLGDPLALGTFNVNFVNDWSNDPAPNSYDADIRFYQVPAPGALALLGMAGLVSSRRRRR